MIVPSAPQSRDDVSGHYHELDETYRAIWGEHVHHGYWRTGDESDREATEALIELVADRLDPRPGQSLCDIGCGYGASAEFLAASRDVAVTGLTISEAQARIGKARTPAAGSFACLERDWLDNGLADDHFDGAYAIESSEHMADKQRFFDEAWRVLKPGGRLVACVWLADSDPTRWQIDHLLEPICREGRLAGMGHCEEYRAMAQRAGFVALSYDDISHEVRRTWTICARRVAKALATNRDFRRFALSSQTRNRGFMLSLLRLIWALRSGAMHYGVFAWEKPCA